MGGICYYGGTLSLRILNKPLFELQYCVRVKQLRESETALKILGKNFQSRLSWDVPLMVTISGRVFLRRAISAVNGFQARANFYNEG